MRNNINDYHRIVIEHIQNSCIIRFKTATQTSSIYKYQHIHYTQRYFLSLCGFSENIIKTN